MGLIEAMCGMMFYLYEAEERTFYSIILILILIFDSLIMHMPFTETAREWGKNNDNFSLNIMIAASTLMAAGFEDLS